MLNECLLGNNPYHVIARVCVFLGCVSVSVCVCVWISERTENSINKFAFSRHHGVLRLTCLLLCERALIFVYLASCYLIQTLRNGIPYYIISWARLFSRVWETFVRGLNIKRLSVAKPVSMRSSVWCMAVVISSIGVFVIGTLLGRAAPVR